MWTSHDINNYEFKLCNTLFQDDPRPSIFEVRHSQLGIEKEDKELASRL